MNSDYTNDFNLIINRKMNSFSKGNNLNGNFKEEKICDQCEEILCIKENEILDDFLERLTNFTYNN